MASAETPTLERPTRFELVLATAGVLLVAYAFARWRGWLGGEPTLRSWPTFLMACGVAALPVGGIVRRWSNALGWVLAICSPILITWSLIAG